MLQDAKTRSPKVFNSSPSVDFSIFTKHSSDAIHDEETSHAEEIQYSIRSMLKTYLKAIENKHSGLKFTANSNLCLF